MAYNCSRGPVDILSLTVDAVGLWGSDNLNNNEDQLQSPQEKNVAKPLPQLQPKRKMSPWLSFNFNINLSLNPNLNLNINFNNNLNININLNNNLNINLNGAD